MSGKKHDDDSDLHDLLKGDGSHQNTNANSNNNNKNGNSDVELTPLNLEHLETELERPIRGRSASSSSSSSSPLSTCLTLFCAYATYMCEYTPKLCLTLALIALVIPTYFLVSAILNPTEQYGIIRNDYTNIQSEFDLTVGKIDHWCLKGDNDSCRCEDPLQPQSRGEFRAWSHAHKGNQATIQRALEEGTSIDIAFLGESVIEEMDGRWFGDQTSEMLNRLDTLFRQHFDRKKGASLQGIALGIAGDTVRSPYGWSKKGRVPLSPCAHHSWISNSPSFF